MSDGGNSFRIDIVSDANLEKIFEVVCGVSYSESAVGYSIDDKKGLIFYNYGSSDKCIKLPFKLDAKGMTYFTESWLKELNSDYKYQTGLVIKDFKFFAGPRPDIDGDCKKGFRVYNEAWGHIGGDHSAFVAILPHWTMYGK